MLVIIGLIVLLAAVVVGVTGVLTNAGAAHLLTDHFAVLGYHVTGSTGTLFLYGMVVGAVAGIGLAVLLAGARRAASRGRAARRDLERTRHDAVPKTPGPRTPTEVHQYLATGRAARRDPQRTGHDTVAKTPSAQPRVARMRLAGLLAGARRARASLGRAARPDPERARRDMATKTPGPRTPPQVHQPLGTGRGVTPSADDAAGPGPRTPPQVHQPLGTGRGVTPSADDAAGFFGHQSAREKAGC